MKLICLGTGGFHNTETNQSNCYMVPELGIVFDGGTGFFRVTKNLCTPYLEIFLSHAHMDHVCGLHCIEEIFNITECKDVTIYGNEGVLKAISTFFDPPLFPNRPPFKTHPIKSGDVITTKSGAIIHVFDVLHRGPCLGYKLEHEGHTMAYLTDTYTDPNSPYLPIVSNVNLMLHEVFFENAKAGICKGAGHTDPHNYALICNIVKPGKAITIHHNPNGNCELLLKEIKSEYDNVEIAKDNAEYQF